MFDYHVHSVFSKDGKDSLEEIYCTAIKKGFQEIAITDHVEKFRQDAEDWNIDFEKYLSEIDIINGRYGENLTLKSGVELGVQESSIDKIKSYMADKKVDFIIASVHYAKDKYIYSTDFHEGKTQKQAYLDYLNEILSVVNKFDEYNVLGHLDLISRCGLYLDGKLHYSEYGALLDEILKVIIERGRGIEVNSSGYWCGIEAVMPDFEIIKRYKELGGEIITIGSDAHCKEDIGSGVEEGIQVLRAAGFKYVCTFQNKKPKFIRI